MFSQVRKTVGKIGDCRCMEFLTLSRRRSSARNVPSGEERGETDASAGYNKLCKIRDTGESVQTKLDRFLLSYRVTPTALGKSPTELLMNRQPRIRFKTTLMTTPVYTKPSSYCV